MVRHVMFFCLLMLVMGTPILAVEEEVLSSDVEVKVAAPQKLTKKEEERRDALRKMVEEKKAELNGNAWNVEIKSQSGKGLYVGRDVLNFQNEKFQSEKTEKNGYKPTNYTLTVQEDRPTVWETMQTNEKGEVTFWRGEWKEDVMTGVISRQFKEGSEDYYFSSLSKKTIPKTTEEETMTAEETSTPATERVLGSNETPAPEPVTTSKSAKPKKSRFF